MRRFIFCRLIVSCFLRYATFSERASRSEYLCFLVFWLIVVGAGIGGAIADYYIFNLDVFTHLYHLIMTSLLPAIVLFSLVPLLSCSVRRLHDMDKSGWWLIMAIIPLLNLYLFFILVSKKGTAGENRFGDDSANDKLIAGLARFLERVEAKVATN